jgi:RHS repeat-associated protein
MQLMQNAACPPPPAPGQSPSTVFYNSNNQVTFASNVAPLGYAYDQAGNVLSDNINQYLYDAEGRICAVANTPVPGMTTMTGYMYNAEGVRVAKGTIDVWSCDPSVSGFKTTKDYILGLSGEQVTEVDVSAGNAAVWAHTNAWAAGKLLGTYDTPVAALHFYLTDPLGTRRVQTTAGGVPEQTCSSLPFGDSETCSTTPTEHLFTGKERDTESGNDYFGARYYSSSMGRFMSPDWSANAEPVPYAALDNPQSLNLYGYLHNNPLSGVDVDGHCDSSAEAWLIDDGFYQLAAAESCNQDAMSDYLNGQRAAQQQDVPAPAGSDPTARLNLNGVSVTVDYTFGSMNSSIYQGGVDIIATPSGCGDCSWGQVIERTGDQSQPLHKDGQEIGPLYGNEGGPANQLKDRPASFKGVVQTVTATSVLGRVKGHTFTPIGAMTWGYSINGRGGVTMIGPRVAKPEDYSSALMILRNASSGTGWQIQ